MDHLRAVVVALIVGVAALAAVSSATAASPLALDDAAKQQQMLGVLEHFVPFTERFWTATDLREPRTGYFAAVGPGVTQPRGAGNVALSFATLLTARPDQAAFAGVPRSTLEEQAIQTIRHEALTSKLSGAGYNRWGQGTWQASLEMYGWGFAAKLLWADLDADTRALVQKVVTGEADILVTKPPAKGVDGDTGAEDNGWNSPAPALASAMFPDDLRRPAWDQAMSRHAVNASTREQDRDAATPMIDGQPLGAWFAGAVVHPDLTMENHGYFNPIYQQVVHANMGEGAIIRQQAGLPVPDAFSFRTEQIWDGVLGPLVSDDGDIIMTAGQDWTSKDYQHLLYLSVLATRFHRADASVAESRALELVARRQATHADGSIVGQPQLGYESMLIKRLSMAWWNHHLFGPSPVPTADELAADRARTGGVHEYPYIGVVQAPLRDAFVSMSWDDQRAMGLVVPTAAGHADDPILTAYAPRSLIGAASGAPGPHSCECGTDRFSTAGTIGTRRFSMTAFPDGVTMLLDRGTGRTFNLAFEQIPGLTGERPVYSAGGEGLGDLTGTWANVADRLGMVVEGGAGLRAADVAGANPYRQLDGSKDTGSGNRGALVLPHSDRQETARLAAGVVQPDVPDGWSALYGRAPDGTGRLAVARWGGADQAPLMLTDDRGAPVTQAGGTIDGDRAEAATELKAPASHGETIRYLVHTDGALQARALDGDRAQLVNDGAAPVHVTVTHVGDDGRTLTASRTITAGEAVVARLVGGELVMAGPEYEHVRDARARMAALREAVGGWAADGTLSHGAATSLRAQLDAIVWTLDRMLDAVTAETPDTARASAALDAAQLQVALLPLVRRLPDAVGERVAADRAATLQALDRARTEGLTAIVRLAATGPALQGEMVHIRAVVLNRGLAAVRDGKLTVAGPAGWATASVDVPPIAPGAAETVELDLPVPADAPSGSQVPLTGTLAFRQGLRSRTSTGVLGLVVRPALDLSTDTPVVPLAAGGVNRAVVHAVNHTGRDLPVRIVAKAADGITVDAPADPVVVAAGATQDISLPLRNASITSGESELTVTADAAGGAHAEEVLTLRHSANLALNGVGAPWPAPFASSQQPDFGPALATDGSASTFWVSVGTTVATGPSPSNPIALGSDLGAPVTVGRVIMTPRSGYGPKTYTIDVSDDGTTWRQVASVPAAASSGPTATSFAPTVARWVRIRITVGWDRGGAARNVQVAELDVRPA
jgi:hypothetical protein